MYILVLVLVLVSTCGTYAVHVVYIHDIRVHMYVMYRTHTSINMCGHVYHIREHVCTVCEASCMYVCMYVHVYGGGGERCMY